MRKTDILKTCWKIKFLVKKIWRNALALKSKKVQGILRETFWHYHLQLLFAYKTVSQISFNFSWETKGFYQRFWGNEVDFRDVINVSPNILAKIKISLISSCHWKTLVPFCLQKKRPESTFLTFLWPPKQHKNWLFSDIWCYLFSACFDWKIDFFQQTVVRVYYIYP